MSKTLSCHANNFNVGLSKSGNRKNVVVLENEETVSEDGNTIEKPVELTPQQQVLENRLQSTLNLIQLGIIDPKEGPIVLNTHYDPNEPEVDTSVSACQVTCIVLIVFSLMTLVLFGIIFLFGKFQFTSSGFFFYN
jgi:hypothetical protein